MQLYKKHSKCAELFYDVSNRRFIGKYQNDFT